MLPLSGPSLCSFPACSSPTLLSIPPSPRPSCFTLSLHDALPISVCSAVMPALSRSGGGTGSWWAGASSSESGSSHPPTTNRRSEEHTSELQSRGHLVCRLLLEKKNMNIDDIKAFVMEQDCDVFTQ